MSHLSIALLGPLQVSLNGNPVTSFESAKVRALLAFLVAEFERDVPAVKEMLEKKKSGKWELRAILESGRRQLDDLGKTLRAKEVAWYLLYCLRVCPRPTPSFLSVGLCWLAVCGGV